MNAPYLYLEINIICILVLGYLLTKYRDAQVLRYDLLLCEADEEQQILDLCADIRSALAASNVHSGVPYNLEMSIGYAVYDPAFTKPEEFVARADAHMYEQKRKMQSATENEK